MISFWVKAGSTADWVPTWFTSVAFNITIFYTLKSFSQWYLPHLPRNQLKACFAGVPAERKQCCTKIVPIFWVKRPDLSKFSCKEILKIFQIA